MRNCGNSNFATNNLAYGSQSLIILGTIAPPARTPDAVIVPAINWLNSNHHDKSHVPAPAIAAAIRLGLTPAQNCVQFSNVNPVHFPSKLSPSGKSREGLLQS